MALKSKYKKISSELVRFLDETIRTKNSVLEIFFFVLVFGCILLKSSPNIQRVIFGHRNYTPVIYDNVKPHTPASIPNYLKEFHDYKWNIETAWILRLRIGNYEIMKLHYTISRTDYFLGVSYIYRRMWFLKIPIIYLFSDSLWGIVKPQLGKDDFYLSLTLAILACGLMHTAIYYGIILMCSTISTFTKNASLSLGDQNLELTANAFVEINSLGTDEIYLNSIRSLKETRSYLFIFLGFQKCLIIPRNQIPKSDFQQLTTVLKDYLRRK